MKTTRRSFLGAAAAAATATAVDHPSVLKIGLIGAGGYGMTDARAALAAGGTVIAAVCDVDSEHLSQAIDELGKLQGSRPKGYRKYADLLDEAELDAVIIATPPHWHALPFLAALEKGLDIYCEKPLAYDVREGQAMAAAAAGRPNIVQIGFQRRQSRALKEAAQFIAAGGAGRIVQADVQIHYRAGVKDASPQDPPASLDWDLWCGPAPKIPYSPQVGHRNWRLEKAIGHGHLVDWGIHLIDACRVMLDLGMPRSVTAAGGIYQFRDVITTPDTLSVHFEFERCPLVWRHRLWGAEEYTPEINNGILFFGERATVFASDAQWVVIPQGKPQAREVHEVKTDMGLDHMKDFLNAVKTRGRTSGPIDDAWRSTATVQLGMIAYETASTVCWDEAQASIVDNAAAASLLKREYRRPWRHPYGRKEA